MTPAAIRAAQAAARAMSNSAWMRSKGTGYDRERPPLFAEALRAAKRAVDPAGILDPGVLIDASRLRPPSCG